MLRAARAQRPQARAAVVRRVEELDVEYAPSWVKRDQARFPRAALPDGRGVDILSPFGAATLAADSRAFAALDGAPEAGRRRGEHGADGPGRERDRHAAGGARPQPGRQRRLRRAGAARAGRLPRRAQGRARARHAAHVARSAARETAGTWAELFGEGDAAEEVFTAWHFARFADQLARAGKAEYPLPMYVNVALNRPGRLPGEYPSGGPLPHLLDVWKAGAPAVDFIAPDIYFPNFVEIVAALSPAGQPAVHSRRAQRRQSGRSRPTRSTRSARTTRSASRRSRSTSIDENPGMLGQRLRDARPARARSSSRRRAPGG